MKQTETTSRDVRVREQRNLKQLYTRMLPGGARVSVELLVSNPGDVISEQSRGRVVLDSVRSGESEPVIVHEASGGDPNDVVDELLRVATDNAAIARRVIDKRNARAD